MKEKIELFIIDTDPEALKEIELILSKHLIRSKSFTDPVDALEQLTKNHPHAVLIDHDTPLVDGRGLIVRISERYLFQYLSVFLMTKIDVTQLDITKFRTLGFNEMIQKPIKENDLLILLKNAGIINKFDAA